MSKYYVTVHYMSGHNSKIDALNNEIRTYEDMLITTDESKDIICKNLEELTAYLNNLYPRCKEIRCEVYDKESSLYSTKPHVSIGYHSEQQAVIWFHKITREK